MGDVMKSLVPAILLVLASASPGWTAEDGAHANANANANGVALGGTSAAAPSETCVEVEIGGERSQKLDCINQQLKQQVDRLQPAGNASAAVGNMPPYDASSPAVKLHGFNETALQQQYGKNLGKSVVPFRPTKP